MRPLLSVPVLPFSSFGFYGRFLALDSIFVVLLQLKNGGVAKAKGEGEKEKECTTECKSRRRRDEKAPWALNYERGGWGDWGLSSFNF